MPVERPLSRSFLHTVHPHEDCGLEISFLLDSSESAKDNHEQEKQFAIRVVDRLQGTKLQTGRSPNLRVALLQYSSHVITEQTFKDWRGTENFKARITPIIYIGHGTYTTYAITNMTKIYREESSPGSIRVAVLLTDGISHPRNPDIFSAVAEAKNQGIKFFTLGITRAANEPTNIAQLRLLSSTPAARFLHNLQDEDIVEKMVAEIVSIRPVIQQPALSWKVMRWLWKSVCSQLTWGQACSGICADGMMEMLFRNKLKNVCVDGQPQSKTARLREQRETPSTSLQSQCSIDLLTVRALNDCT